jgi:exo-1,4-beta-D-glucosaminidase
VYDHYATGDKKTARIRVVNQTLQALSGLSASVQFINTDGEVKYADKKTPLAAGPLSSVLALEAPRIQGLGPAFFIRCRLNDSSGNLLADNVYWQSAVDDEVGPPENDNAFALSQESWADLTALNSMPPADVEASGALRTSGGWATATVRLSNRSKGPAFFLRAEIVNGPDGEEILPVTWDDNYVTIFGGESRVLEARYKISGASGKAISLRLQGRNLPVRVIRLN